MALHATPSKRRGMMGARSKVMGKGTQKPRLSDAVERRELDGDVVLYLKDFDTLLHVSADMAGIVDKLDGEHSLDQLEVLAAGGSRGLAYQELMQLLAGLWDRGMLDDAEALGEALFPNKRFRSVEHARASRRLHKLLSWQCRLLIQVHTAALRQENQPKMTKSGHLIQHQKLKNVKQTVKMI